MIPTIKTHGYKWLTSDIKNRPRTRVKRKKKDDRLYIYMPDERERRNEMAKIRYKLKKMKPLLENQIEKEKNKLIDQLKQLKKKDE